MKNNFLHNHHSMEIVLGVDKNHVIVDREDWEKAKEYSKKYLEIADGINKLANKDTDY